ncbi:MFS sugar [Mycena kentingensis (nom. inval.)]|nr:MFS sugar [Mycena kentingensis (nom. inval.)]
MSDLEALLQSNDSTHLRDRVAELVTQVLARVDDPAANQIPHERRLRLIEDLPRLTEDQVKDTQESDSLCPICYTPFLAILAEEETALAMDSPAHPADELGVTKLDQSWQCGHLFCRRDISKWIRSGHASCPMCRRSLVDSTAPQSATAAPSDEDAALLAHIQSFMEQVHSSGSVAYVDHEGEFRGFGDPLYVPQDGYNEDRTRTKSSCAVANRRGAGRGCLAIATLNLNFMLKIPTYIWPTLFTALGGFLWGFDTGSIGPIIVMKQFEEQFGTISPAVQGLFVSCMIATAALASLFSGTLSDRVSRTYTIAIGSLVYAVGAVIACFSRTLVQIFVGRCITGLGEGIFISSITVYVLEISPAAMRGRTMATVQLANTVGITAGYFTCFGTVKYDNNVPWRLPLGVQAAVALLLAVGTPLFPHSPHWLLNVGRVREAEAATAKLGLELTEIRKEDEIAGADAAAAKLSIWKQVRALWAHDVRFRTLFGLFLMSMQQACGIDAVLYYAPTLFQQAGLSSTQASFLASGVSGIVMVVVTAVSQFFQDRLSRRTQMIGGGSVIAGSMLLMGTLYASAASTTAGKRTLVALIYIFVAAFVGTWAMTTRVITSELQPKRTRASATALAQSSSWITNYIVAVSTPAFLQSTTSGPYFLFGSFALLTVFVCLFFQPETKGLSLDALDRELEPPKIRQKLTKLFPAGRLQTSVELSSI